MKERKSGNVFISRSTKDCMVVIPKEHVVVEETAARELVSYIEKSLGVKLSIVSERVAKGKCIYVGQTEYASAAGVVGSSKENWIIKMHDGNLILTGGKERGDRGIIYAVYHFLEDILGVRWWNPCEEDVLSLTELSLAEDLYREGTPYFAFRKIYTDPGIGAAGFKHLARTRTNAVSPIDDNIPDGVLDPLVRKYGGATHAGRPHHCHVIGKYFPIEQYYAEHPDWWAWNRQQGKHLKDGHPCLSNEGFFQALCDKLLAYVREDMEIAERTGVELPYFYAFSLDDRSEYCFCQCDECERVRKEAGDSGYVLKFVNRLAREVAKVNPLGKMDYSAYLGCAELPKDDTLPDKNVIIQLADVYNDLLRGVHSPTNKNYLQLIERWSAICRKSGSEMFIYDYMFNMELNYPLPIFHRLKDTITTFAECGVTSTFIETENSFADAWEINKYMISHLFEDPYADEEELVNDFVMRYYGKAGKTIKEYFDLLRETADRNKIHVYCCDEDSPFNYIDLPAVIKGNALFDQAVLEVGEQEPYRSRVNWLRKPLDTVIACRYFDFKKLAELKGESFDLTIKEVKARAIAALEEFVQQPYHAKSKVRVGSEIAYIAGLPEKEEVFDIPDMLKGVKEEDIYQFPMKYMVKFVMPLYERIYGFSTVADEEISVSGVMKLSFDKATEYRAQFTMVPTSRDAEPKKPLHFQLRDDNEIVAEPNIYLEDIVQDGYHLYKMGSISGISKSHSARLLIPIEVSVNLSGLAVVFPMDACDVYLSMKFTGEVYGGKKEDENAIYFERMIVVRKK